MLFMVATETWLHMALQPQPPQKLELQICTTKCDS